MNEYAASNGVRIEAAGREEPYNLWNIGGNEGLPFTSAEWVALREFFRAEEDERLGRWRFPENPDYVVYAQGLDHDGFRYAMAVYEPTGNAGKWQEGQSVSPPMTDPQHLGIYAVAAYFDAHPEPKPWHEAKRGDVWALTCKGVEEIWYVRKNHFRDVDGLGIKMPLDNTLITAGRRIWPES